MAKSSSKLEHPLGEPDLIFSFDFWFNFVFGIRDLSVMILIFDVVILYLVRADLTIGQFVYVVRKRIKLSLEKAIFIFCEEHSSSNRYDARSCLMSAWLPAAEVGFQQLKSIDC
ncbi:hypothetical protein Droror1_Dr00000563 [Drosera rotundifolia]